MSESVDSAGSPAHQAVVPSPINGVVPPLEHRFKPGQSGNPAGRPCAGATIKEHINVMAASDLSESDLRAIARDAKAPWTKRAAANRILRTLETPDLADFQDAVDGVADLQSLRASGLNTEVVKKMKVKTKTYKDPSTESPVTETEREIELFDRAGEDFDRIIDRTVGKPTQHETSEIDIKADVRVTELKVVFDQ
jgi:hypothetical protein